MKRLLFPGLLAGLALAQGVVPPPEFPLFLTARGRLSLGGPLAQGLRLDLGSSYRPLPNLVLRGEVGLGGPAVFGLGFGGEITTPEGSGLVFFLSQKGGLFLGAKGAEFSLAGRFAF